MILSNQVTNSKSINRYQSLESDLYTIHGDKYDFTMSCYVGMSDYMMIWCKKHQNFFWIKPSNLLWGQNCPICGREKRSEVRIEKSRNKFKAEAELKHPDKYDYTMVWHRGIRIKVMVWCKACKKMIWIKPKSLLRGDGCYDCGTLFRAMKRIKQASLTFNVRAEFVNPDKYNYTMVWYRGVYTPVMIWCKSCQRFFWVNPSNILDKKSRWCDCSSYSFKSYKPAIVYYIRVETFNQIAWKIGITNNSVKERFKKWELELITELKVWVYDTGKEARAKEKEILALYSDYLYKGDTLLENGNTELFDRDVLNLDK